MVQDRRLFPGVLACTLGSYNSPEDEGQLMGTANHWHLALRKACPRQLTHLQLFDSEQPKITIDLQQPARTRINNSSLQVIRYCSSTKYSTCLLCMQPYISILMYKDKGICIESLRIQIMQLQTNNNARVQ